MRILDWIRTKINPVQVKLTAEEQMVRSFVLARTNARNKTITAIVIGLVLGFAAAKVAHCENVGVSGTADEVVTLCGRHIGDTGTCLYTRQAYLVVNGGATAYMRWRSLSVDIQTTPKYDAPNYNTTISEKGSTDDTTSTECPERSQTAFTSGNQLPPVAMTVMFPGNTFRTVTVYFGNATYSTQYVSAGTVSGSIVINGTGCNSDPSQNVGEGWFVNVGGTPIQ